MSTRDEDDSRPGSRPLVAPPPTARDVPIAKYEEASVGTSPPRGLRGPSLLPGQGAPDPIVPGDIELAVLREAETLDGPRVARAAARRGSELSPSPTPVSVEVPRVRSAPPSSEDYATPTSTTSAHSVQSGTLMSIGSVDPRAPTERSLPSPRMLSNSERAAYSGPEAVIDRTPVSALPNAAQEASALAKSVEFPELVSGQRAPSSEPMPYSSARSLPLGSGPPASSARRSQKLDSPAPLGRDFARPPRSYSPVSPTPTPRSPAPASVKDRPPRFQVHSELDAVPREFVEDNFDLRSVSTQREPLAGRRPVASSDWSPAHEPGSERRRDSWPVERPAGPNPSSSSAITMLVGRGRSTSASSRRSFPDPEPLVPQRASLPLSWVISAAAFALALAFLVAWAMRAPTVQEAPPANGAAADEGSRALSAAVPPALAVGAPPVTTENAEPRLAPSAAPRPAAAPKALPVVSGPRGPELAGSAAATAHPSPSPGVRADHLHAPSAPSSADVPATIRQSIY